MYRSLLTTFLIGVMGGGLVWFAFMQPEERDVATLDLSQFAGVHTIQQSDEQFVLKLVESETPEFEENPMLFVQLVVTDAETGQLVDAEIRVGYAAVVGEVIVLDEQGYEQKCAGHTCEFLFAHVEPDHAYFLLVTAEGYEPWPQRLVWDARWSVKMGIPVKLTPITQRETTEIHDGITTIFV